MLLCLFSELIAPQAMALFAPSNLIGESVAFETKGLSAPAVVGAAALNGVLRGVGDPRAALDAAALAALINVFLDMLFGVAARAQSRRRRSPLHVRSGSLSSIRSALREAFKWCRGPSSRKRSWKTFATRGSGGASANVMSAGFLGSNDGLHFRHQCGPDVTGGASGPEAVLYYSGALSPDASAVSGAAARGLGDVYNSKREQRATRLLGWGFVTGVVLAALLSSFLLPCSRTTYRVAQEASTELLRIVAPLQLLSSLVFVGDGILQGSRDFKFEAFAVALASVGGAAVLILEQRPPDGALATGVWNAVASMHPTILQWRGRFGLSARTPRWPMSRPSTRRWRGGRRGDSGRTRP